MFYFARAHKLIFALLNHRKEGMEIFQQQKKVFAGADRLVFALFFQFDDAHGMQDPYGFRFTGRGKCLLLLQNTKGN